MATPVLLTGGATGIAFLIHYATEWNFGLIIFLINVPFFGHAWQRMGKDFTLETVAAVAMLPIFVNVLPALVGFLKLSTPFAAVMGGLLMGTGMLMLFRHRSSLGDLNVLVLYLQERSGWRAGRIQMALDCGILLASFASVDWKLVALSKLGAAFF